MGIVELIAIGAVAGLCVGIYLAYQKYLYLHRFKKQEKLEALEYDYKVAIERSDSYYDEMMQTKQKLEQATSRSAELAYFGDLIEISEKYWEMTDEFDDLRERHLALGYEWNPRGPNDIKRAKAMIKSMKDYLGVQEAV